MKPDFLDDYGYSDDPYAAQTMLTAYREGMDVGQPDLSGLSGLSVGVGLGVVGDLNELSGVTSPSNDIPASEPDYGFSLFGGGGKAATSAAGAAAETGAKAGGGGIGSGWGVAIDAGIALATTGIGLGIQASQAKKQREHEAKMAKEQQKIAEQQAQLAALTAGQGGFPWGWAVAGVVGLGLVGGGIYWYTSRDKEKK